MAAPSSRSSIFQLLKQRFVGPKRVELEVSAYGKLPIYKDFLRHGLAAPEAQAFRRWLDRGVSKFWETHAAYGDAPIPSQALMVSFPATSHQILAYLWDSHDHGGLRRFPFVLFVSLPLSKSEAPLSLLYALEQLVEQGKTMRRRLAQMDSLDAYYPFIRTARVEIEMHGDKSLKERLAERQEPNLGDLGDIFYGEQDPQDRWPALIRHLRQLAQQPQRQLAVRLPRTEAFPSWELNALYCLLLKKARSNSRKPLQLFYPPGVAGGGVTILHRDLRPDDIFAFHPEMPDYQGVDDLRRQVPGAACPEPRPSADTVADDTVADDSAADDSTADDSTAAIDLPEAEHDLATHTSSPPQEDSSGDQEAEANGLAAGDSEDGLAADADTDADTDDGDTDDGDTVDGDSVDGDSEDGGPKAGGPEDGDTDGGITDAEDLGADADDDGTGDAEPDDDGPDDDGTDDDGPGDDKPDEDNRDDAKAVDAPITAEALDGPDIRPLPSALGKGQRSMPPIALLNEDLLNKDPLNDDLLND